MIRKATVMMGLPATGKTTKAKAISVLDGAFVSSFRAVLHSVCKRRHGSFAIKTPADYEFAAKVVLANLELANKKGHNVVVDNYYLTKVDRARLMAYLRNHYDVINLQHFKKPDVNNQELWREWRFRLNYRNRTGLAVTPVELAKMEKAIELPSLDEGFDSISTFDVWGQRISLEK